MTGGHQGDLVPRRLPDVSAVEWGTQPLPYGVSVTHIQQPIQIVYSILDDMSRPLIGRGIGRVEDFMLGNSLSGMISELLVQQLAQTTGMKRNIRVGGFPDLLPEHYPGNAYQDASDGIETKTTIQPRKLEAHHQSVGDFLLFQYFVDVPDPRRVPLSERWPIEFYGVVFGRVGDKSWWNKASTGRTGRKTQNTTLKARYLEPILTGGTLFLHPDRDVFLAPMDVNREMRRQTVQHAGPELEVEDVPDGDED
jgi:hypothetical protein